MMHQSQRSTFKKQKYLISNHIYEKTVIQIIMEKNSKVQYKENAEKLKRSTCKMADFALEDDPFPL